MQFEHNHMNLVDALPVSFVEFSVGVGAFVMGLSKISSFLRRLRSIVAHRDHFVLCPSGSRAFLVVTLFLVTQYYIS